jgi:glutathione S-transferase
MKLYGTITSPYTRRVAVVAAELGEPVERIDTASEAGMAELRKISPIRKVPVAILDEKVVFDSHQIHACLVAKHGAWGTQSADEVNRVAAIDGAVDSLIQLFYLRRDGVGAVTGSVFETRQLERVDAIFWWLSGQVSDGSFSTGFGLAELSLIAATDWMELRKAYPLEQIGACETVRARWRDRPSLVSTRPHT